MRYPIIGILTLLVGTYVVNAKTDAECIKQCTVVQLVTESGKTIPYIDAECMKQCTRGFREGGYKYE